MRKRRRRKSQAPRTRRPIDHFRTRLGHRFRRLDLLEQAMTHGSYANDHEVADYERLEFVGDAALGLVVTEIVHFDCPEWTRHRRQEAKSAIVNNESLAAAGRALALPDGLRVGRGQDGEQGARSSDRILANVFEAILGAAWLDGGLGAVRGIVGRAFGRRFRSLGINPSSSRPVIARKRLLLAPAAFLRRLLRLTTPTERALRYTFRQRAALRTAMDPGPARPERRGKGRRQRRRRGRRPPVGGMDWHAQRFLGRDVLHLLIADTLHTRFPDWDEGRMTLARMRLLEKDFLLRLGERWLAPAGDSRAGIVEALLGALYLDGGIRAPGRALRAEFRRSLDELEDPDLELLDPKTRLQNHIARAGGDPPTYRELAKPDRDRVAVSVRLEDGKTFRGVGRGIKEAEKDAAAKAFQRLRSRPAKRTSTTRTGPRREPDRTHSDNGSPPRAANPKGNLQELIVRERKSLPTYRVISEEGPEHDKTFHVEVLVDGEALARGKGPSKRSAEARAAAAALESSR